MSEHEVAAVVNLVEAAGRGTAGLALSVGAQVAKDALEPEAPAGRTLQCAVLPARSPRPKQPRAITKSARPGLVGRRPDAGCCGSCRNRGVAVSPERAGEQFALVRVRLVRNDMSVRPLPAEPHPSCRAR
jgi:hypothetical protein